MLALRRRPAPDRPVSLFPRIALLRDDLAAAPKLVSDRPPHSGFPLTPFSLSLLPPSAASIAHALGLARLRRVAASSRAGLSRASFLLLPLVVAALLLAGCSSVSARKVVALDRFQRFFVERRLNENNRLDELIVAELQRLGRQASSGPLTMMPEKTEVLVTYDARWTWDFKTYLIDLSLEFHTVFPSKKLADGRYYQPSLRPKSPPDAVRELLGRLFGK